MIGLSVVVIVHKKTGNFQQGFPQKETPTGCLMIFMII